MVMKAQALKAGKVKPKATNGIERANVDDLITIWGQNEKSNRR